MWPHSAPSSISACTRTGWYTSPRWRKPLSRIPARWLKPGDIVRVKVIEVDKVRKRIGLTLRLDDEVGPRTAREEPPHRNNGDRPPMRPSEPDGVFAEAFRRASQADSKK